MPLPYLLLSLCLGSRPCPSLAPWARAGARSIAASAAVAGDAGLGRRGDHPAGRVLLSRSDDPGMPDEIAPAIAALKEAPDGAVLLPGRGGAGLSV